MRAHGRFFVVRLVLALLRSHGNQPGLVSIGLSRGDCRFPKSASTSMVPRLLRTLAFPSAEGSNEVRQDSLPKLLRDVDSRLPGPCRWSRSRRRRALSRPHPRIRFLRAGLSKCAHAKGASYHEQKRMFHDISCSRRRLLVALFFWGGGEALRAPIGLISVNARRGIDGGVETPHKGSRSTRPRQ